MKWGLVRWADTARRKAAVDAACKIGVGNKFQWWAVLEIKFCLDEAYLGKGMSILRLWPFVTNGGVWLMWGWNEKQRNKWMENGKVTDSTSMLKTV